MEEWIIKLYSKNNCGLKSGTYLFFFVQSGVCLVDFGNKGSLRQLICLYRSDNGNKEKKL